MHRKTLVIVCVLVLVFVFALIAGVSYTMGRSPKETKAPSGKVAAFDFTLEDLNGDPHTLSDYRGKFVFLNFWATWCSPCRREMPAMQKLYEEADKEQFVMLAVNAKQKRDVIKAFADENGYTYPILMDPNYKVSGKYRVRAIPVTYLIDKEGNIIGRVVGGREWTWEEIEPLLNK
jgi:cytochrome c-type biogenesis protein